MGLNGKEFDDLFLELRPKRSKIFELIPPDRYATASDLEKLELDLGYQLSSDYREFLSKYGGGQFGLVEVGSADPASDLYLPKINAAAQPHLRNGLVAISDDHCGGWYFVETRDQTMTHAVRLWNVDGGYDDRVSYETIFDFVAAQTLID